MRESQRQFDALGEETDAARVRGQFAALRAVIGSYADGFRRAGARIAEADLQTAAASLKPDAAPDAQAEAPATDLADAADAALDDLSAQADGLTAEIAQIGVEPAPPLAGELADGDIAAAQADAEAAPQAAAPAPRELRPEERNFRFEREEDLAPHGRVTRIRANLEAITLLRALESEDRLAGEDEKRVLARYSGWGADKEVFNDEMARRVPRAKQAAPHHQVTHHAEVLAWDREYGRFHTQIKEMLTDEEWKRAAASTLNAHYTAPALCHGLWDLARHAGFRGGSVLEPAIGTGQIIGAMPEDFAAVSTVTGVELDSLSARLAAKLYPQADIHAESFQEAARGTVPDRLYDLVITNVPFSDVAPANQGFADEPAYNLHNWFIRASLEKLKPGGISIIITSASTLQNNFNQREALSEHLQFLGAVRLPNSAFAANANTAVVTDVLLLRRPDELQVDHFPFRSLLPVALATAGVFTPHEGHPSQDERHQRANVNEYFAHRPQMVLGYHDLNGKMYGGPKADGQYTVTADAEDPRPLAEQFAAAVALLPADVPNPSLRKLQRAARREADLPDLEENALVRLRARLGTKVGSFEVPDEAAEAGMKVGVTDRFGFLAPVPWRLASGEANPDAKLPRGFNPEKADALALDYVELRRRLKNVICTDLNPAAGDADSEAVRASLRLAYDAFTLKWGQLNKTPALMSLLGGDTELGSVLALEKVRTALDPLTGKDRLIVEPAVILNARTLYPSAMPTGAESIEDGINISLAQYGRISDEYIAGLLGKSEDVRGVRRLIAASGLAFENPATGALESRTQYLSGNVRVKLAQARDAQEKADQAPAGTEGASYRQNVAALEKVQPPLAIFEEIVAPINASWLPHETVSRFAGTLFAQEDNHLQCAFYPNMMQWLVSERYKWTQEVQTQYGTSELNGVKILDSVLNDRHIKITYKDEDGRVVFDEKATNQANAVADTIRQAWKDYLKNTPEARDAVVASYNETFRNVALPEYDGGYLTFPGLAAGPGALSPRKHQRDVAARMITEQCGLVAHGVGFGKTFELCLVAYESRRMGVARKPMIVCDNASYPQFVETVRTAYPQANLLVADELNMTPRNRQTFLAMMATGDWDMILCSHNHLTAMPSKPETWTNYYTEALDDLRATLDTMGSFGDAVSPHKVRQTQKAIERAEETLNKKMEELKDNQDLGAIYFEATGVDLMLVDEIHKFKRVPFATAQGDIKGIDTSSSQRALALLLKAQHIQAQRGEGRGVIGATGTPVTNTMAEIWNMGRLTAPKSLNNFRIPNFDMFTAAFAEKVTAMELNESNGRWRNQTRLAKFINGPDFIQFVRSFSDVKMDRDAVQLDVPKLKGGQIELCTA